MYRYDRIKTKEELLIPLKIKMENNIDNADRLLVKREPVVSFKTENFTTFKGKGSYIVLDFGKEIAGGIRIITRSTDKTANVRLTFGESLSECLSTVGKKNATNDHSTRDFRAVIPFMSDLTFGQTGFRFVKIELSDNKTLTVQNIFAVSKTQEFDFEATIKTNDKDLNKIIDTAIYTLKLNFQNGFIWDGIKRDRLVWCGDLNQEIITSLYCFGNTDNITNSLTFLKDDTNDGEWINAIPTYSAWWVINLIDYYRLSGDKDYFENNKHFAETILKMVDDSITDDGRMIFDKRAGMPFYLDWPTYEKEDAVIGTACVFLVASNKFLELENNNSALSITKKLNCYLNKKSKYKQVTAFQILAGKKPTKDDLSLIEKNGAEGFSTFMTYYLLTALSELNSLNSIDIIKEYYGGMLSKGATTFWEDFDIKWMDNSSTLERLPSENEKDIHADFGRYCYKKFRHSLCHGWSSGVVAFIIENIIGIKVSDGFKKVVVKPNLIGLKTINAVIPTPFGKLEININGKDVKINSPKEIKIVLKD